MNKTDKIVITGAAGLVGQNLVTELFLQGHQNITAIDKHQGNLKLLHDRHPEVDCVHADLSVSGDWEGVFAGAERLFLLQAQITGLTYDMFQKNTLESTRNVINAAKKYSMPFTVFVSSSVVNSIADDNYTRSKIAQEQMMKDSGQAHCTLRPTLMYGWFDPKHLGWLSRFMAKTPVFPVPGHGRYVRQPLYARDFCRALIRCAEMRPVDKVYDIVGQEDVYYIDIIKTIKKVKNFNTIILRLPVPLFRFMMKAAALVMKNPPFVADQLDALMAGDYFKGCRLEEEFSITPTAFADAIQETFTHPSYSKVVLER